MAFTQENDFEHGLVKAFSYMKDLRQALEPSLGYKAALAAQIFNQELFFYHFPRSRKESIRRVRYLMKKIRDENPDILVIMSPLPSYQLICGKEVDEGFKRVLERLPFSFEDRAGEEELYYSLKDASEELGWLFIDNLTALRGYRGPKRLYNAFDYHLTVEASRIIGSNEAEVVSRWIRKARRESLGDSKTCRE
jgi:hypothetical protein